MPGTTVAPVPVQIDLQWILPHKRQRHSIKLQVHALGIAVRPLAISALVFGLVFGGALCAMYFRKVISPDHLSDDVKDVVRLSTGIIGTIAALVLGLLIASAKSSYDARVTQFKQLTTNLVFLDLLLEQYGPETRPMRVGLRNALPVMIDRIKTEHRGASTTPFETTSEAHRFITRTGELTPNNEMQRSLRTHIVEAGTAVAQSRLALFVQSHESIPVPFLVVLVFWLTIIFASFGLFVRPLPVAIVTFFVGALSVSGALLLILEMDQPFAGIFRISTEPLTRAIAPL
jgi:hypothetical protein